MYDKAKIALAMKPLVADFAKKKQQEAGGALVQKSGKAPIKTDKEVAALVGISHDTVNKVEYLEGHADEATKTKLSQRETSIHAAYKKTKEAVRKKQQN